MVLSAFLTATIAPQSGGGTGNCKLKDRPGAVNHFPSGLICVALPHGSPAKAIIDQAKRNPTFAREYNKSAGLVEGYTVGEHTEMALEMRRRYRLGRNLSAPPNSSSSLIGERGIDFALLLHDLKKFEPGEKKDISAEHRRTGQFISPYLRMMPFSENQVATFLDLMFNNDLGSLLYNAVQRTRPKSEQKQRILDLRKAGQLTEAIYEQEMNAWEAYVSSFGLSGSALISLVEGCSASFRERSVRLGISPRVLLENQVAYTQADIGAYTYDSRLNGDRGIPSLDYLFERRGTFGAENTFTIAEDGQRLKFSPYFEHVYALLRSKLE